MPKATIWIKKEDYPIWQSLEDRPDWLHRKLQEEKGDSDG
jgi:hypothetical protein